MLEVESEGSIGFILGLAVGGAEMLKLSSGSLTALAESGGSAEA